MGNFKFGQKKYYIYDWQELWYIEHEIKIGFNAISVLLKSQEKTIIRLKKEAKTWIENEIEQIDFEGGEKDLYHDELVVREYEVIDEVNKVQRNSCVSAIYSLIENVLFQVSQNAISEFQLSNTLDEVKTNGSEISRVIQYFTKYLSIDKTSFASELQIIEKYRVIRNIIIHQGGQVKKNQEITVSQIPNITTYSILDKQYLRIDEIEFIKNLTANGETFLLKLLIELDKKLNQLKRN